MFCVFCHNLPPFQLSCIFGTQRAVFSFGLCCVAVIVTNSLCAVFAIPHSTALVARCCHTSAPLFFVQSCLLLFQCFFFCHNSLLLYCVHRLFAPLPIYGFSVYRHYRTVLVYPPLIAIIARHGFDTYQLVNKLFRHLPPLLAHTLCTE